MLSKTSFFFLLIILSFGNIHAQVFEIKSDADIANQPEWIQLMYQDHPDPEQVTQAYDAYYKTHDFVKNIHTQYYKRWRRAIDSDSNGWFTSGGTIPPARIAADEAEYLSRTEALKLEKGPNSAWECIGPFDFDKESLKNILRLGSIFKPIRFRTQRI